MILTLHEKIERKIYLTSDLHLSHKNIIKYDNRPYNNVDEMNEDIVKRWNEVVDPHDIVIILGDITLYDKSNKIIKILRSLNGVKYFMQGNHDSDLAVIGYKDNYVFDKYLPQLQAVEYTTIDNIKYLLHLCHYPLLDWFGKQKGSYQIFGHTHGNLKQHDLAQLDVSWSIWYKPMEINEIIKIIQKQIELNKTHWEF